MNYRKRILSGFLLLTLMTIVAVTSVSAGKVHDHKQHDDVRPPEKVERARQQQGDAISLRWHAVHGSCDGYRIYHEAGDKLLPNSFSYDVGLAEYEPVQRREGRGRVHVPRLRPVRQAGRAAIGSGNRAHEGKTNHRTERYGEIS